MKWRDAEDSMGVIQIPAEAYYGAQTQRAIDNFPVSGRGLPVPFLEALAQVKQHAAQANVELGLLDGDLGEVIQTAAREVMDGRHPNQFPIDVFQTGSGTSTNMNMNEVLACRANEILTGARSDRIPVHPNDHVNLGQSSNDVIPTTLHVAALKMIAQDLQPVLKDLHDTLQAKSTQFKNIPKIGRTHLQDAVPMGLGQEFSGYARQIELNQTRLKSTHDALGELALGGTAIGTGLNSHPQFAAWVISGLAADTGLPFREAQNHFQAQAAMDGVVATSGVLKTLAVSLTKIANDLRWLSSGPRCGIGEISLPALQPGSSIMPGKVNPVIPEAVLQVAAQVVGNDTTITLAGQSGNFELNVMLPVMAVNLLDSIRLLTNAIRLLDRKCLQGLTANAETCVAKIENSLALVTAFVPFIGYDRAAELAKKAYHSGQTIRQIAISEKVLPETQIDLLLDPLQTIADKIDP